MTTDLKLSFPATTQGLREALKAVDNTGATWNLDAELVSRAQIVVEELFTNTIKYGYGRESDKPVRIHLQADTAFTLTYEDEAASFDPTRWMPDDIDPLADGRPEGKAGIMLIMGLSASARYVPQAIGNRLEVTFATGHDRP
jgi:anti-sigma regulatory factor (Ser/Thr protein kinase)